MPFRVVIEVGRGMSVLDEGSCAKGKGKVLGVILQHISRTYRPWGRYSARAMQLGLNDYWSEAAGGWVNISTGGLYL